MSADVSVETPGMRARAAALAILSEVLRKRRALDLVTDGILLKLNLHARDAGFARAIATETLRRFGQLDAIIRHFVPKAPPQHKCGATPEILLMGACELLFLNVAPHAAVDGANRLAQADAKAVHFKGLINAVLRRVAREGHAILPTQDLRLNVPDWLLQRWVAHYGDGEARAIAGAHLAIPPLDLKLKFADDPCTDFSPDTGLAPGHVRLFHAGRIEALPGYAEGRWWIQDFAASLPVRLFGDVRGRDVIDLCAAPGGKTAELASLGALVTAVDAAPERLALVRENLARLDLKAGLVAADVRDWRPGAPAPFVLLDAPCTATGTIRRHPDIPWIKSAADIAICESLQAELLDAAAEMTAPDGTLVYAVCSLEPEEGVEQVETFLRRRSDFARAAIAPDEVFDSVFISAEGDLRTLPFHWADKGGMDGFYAARLKRLR